ncbi:MAG: lysine transporter LysE, partial [Hyphomicrobiaceae bacterium]
IAITLAVLSGSFLYWLTISNLISQWRHRLHSDLMGKINWWAGMLLITFGCILIGELVLKAFGFGSGLV